MTPKHLALSLGLLIAGGGIFWAGVLTGERRGVNQAVRDIHGWLIPDSVHEYQMLEAGDIEAAKSMCGQRIWTGVEQQDREFPGNEMSVLFREAMPEARRIILVVSNSDWQRLLYGATNHQGRANGRQPFGSETNRTSEAAASRGSP
jgi:hypothetical protein